MFLARFLFRLLLGAVLCLGPLNLLQIGAWASMWGGYAQEFDASTALAMTFDGEHPCELCLTIEKERQALKTSPTAPLPKENKLRIDPFLRPLAPKPEALSCPRLSPPSPFGLVALLGAQTISLEIPLPPPDAGLAS